MNLAFSSGGESTDERPSTGDFGVEVARLRAQRGWTLRELAKRTNVSEGQISNLESGRRNPTPTVAAACDAAFGTGGRLSALAEAARRGAQTKASVEAEPLVAGYGRILEEMKGIGRSSGPRFVATPLRSITRVLTDAGQFSGGGQADEIWLLASRFAEYTGWMAQEAGNPAEALRWTDLAVRWGARGGDETVAAYALVRRAFIAEHRGDTGAAIRLARNAATHPAATSLIRAHAARREAQGHARRGDRGACQEALQRSRSHAQANTEHETATRRWGPRIEHGNLRLIEASCLLALRDFEEAVDLFTAELNHHPATSADSNSQTRFAIRRAIAMVGVDHFDDACRVIEAILPTARQLDSATIRAELSGFVNQARIQPATSGQRDLIDAAAAVADVVCAPEGGDDQQPTGCESRPQLPEEPTDCPSCGGHGRMEAHGLACTACWMTGTVPAWRAKQILEDLQRQRHQSL